MTERRDNVIPISTQHQLPKNGNGGNGSLTEYRLEQLEKKVEGLETKADGMAHQLTRIDTKIGIATWIVSSIGIPILIALLAIAAKSVW